MKNLGKNLYSTLVKVTFILLIILFFLYPFRNLISLFEIRIEHIIYTSWTLLALITFGIIISIFNVKSKRLLVLPQISYYFFYQLIYPLVHKFFNSESKSYIKITNYLISFNNRITRKQLAKYDKKDILILLPHCLQYAQCPYKVTNDINNCHACGKCVIQDFRDIKTKTGIEVKIATGGTLARKIITELRPKIILAVACHRDLTEGIKDINKVPVIGILNTRPNGPCYNTSCDINEIKTIIKQIL